MADSPSGWDPTRVASLNDLEVYLTSDLPQDRSDLLPTSRILREDFEGVSFNFDSEGRACPPSGLKAWTSASKGLLIPNGGMQLMPTSPTLRNEGTTIGFWLWTQRTPGEQKMEKGFVLVNLESAGGVGFVRVGFDTEIHNALRIHVKFNERYERILNTKKNIFPDDQWSHVVVRVGSKSGNNKPEPTLFINTQSITLTEVGGVRFLSAVNVETTSDQRITSMSFWYSDGSRAFEPSESFGTELKSFSSIISMAKNDHTFQVWDVDSNAMLMVSLTASTSSGNPTLVMSVTSSSGSISLVERVKFVANQGTASTSVQINQIDLTSLADSTLHVELALELSGAPLNTNVEYALQVTSGVLRSSTGRFELNVASDEHLTRADIQTSAASLNASLGVRVVAASASATGSNGATDDLAGLQLAPWFAKQSDLEQEVGTSDTDFDTTNLFLESLSTGTGEVVNEMSLCMWIKIIDTSEPQVLASFSQESVQQGVTCSFVDSTWKCRQSAGVRSSPDVLILGLGGSSSESLHGSPFTKTSSCPLGFNKILAGDSTFCTPIAVNIRAETSSSQLKKQLPRVGTLVACQVQARQWNAVANGVELEGTLINDPRANGVKVEESWSFPAEDSITVGNEERSVSQSLSDFVQCQQKGTGDNTIQHCTTSYTPVMITKKDDFESTSTATEWTRYNRSSVVINGTLQVSAKNLGNDFRSCQVNDVTNQYSGRCALKFELSGSEEYIQRELGSIPTRIVGTAARGATIPLYQKTIVQATFLCFGINLMNSDSSVRVRVFDGSLREKATRLYTKNHSNFPLRPVLC